MPHHPTHPAIQLLDGRFYAAGPHEHFTWMRANAPVYWDDEGKVWGVARYADVLEASRHPEVFCSGQSSRPDAPAIPSMINLDDPAHRRRRGLVSRGFTPRRVGAHEPKIRALCRTLLEAIAPKGRCEFVAEVAAPLPMAMIGDLLGVEPEDRLMLQRWSDDLIGGTSMTATPEAIAAATKAFGEYAAYNRRVVADRRARPRDDLMSVLIQAEIDGARMNDEELLQRATDAFSEYADYHRHVVADRRARPRDDLLSVVVHAEIDGQRLSDEEVLQESLLILVGGDETTRHVLSGGMEQLIRHPDLRRALRSDLAGVPVAVEEMLRWVTPIQNMNRTATRDVTLHGERIHGGDKLLLLYASANRDPRQFRDPDVFDPARAPNDHVAFGFGTHYCLGASLARLELRVFFEEVLQRLPDLELATDGPLPRRPANFIVGIETMPVVWQPR